MKTDFIAHKYPLVRPLLVDEKVRMGGLEDIGAMKLNAIAGNGTRLKDFIDIAYLSPFLTSMQIIDAYQNKYAIRNPVMAMKAIIYHNDIDFTEPIKVMDNKYSWKKIKQRLNDMLKTPKKLFAPL